MQGQASFTAQFSDGLHFIQCVVAATAFIGRVFQNDKAGSGQPIVIGLDGGLYMRSSDFTVCTSDEVDGYSAVCGIATRFILVNMGEVVANHLVQLVAMGADCDLVGHRSRRAKQGGLLAEHSGGLGLQCVHGGVVIEHIVADLSNVLEHGWRSAW